MAIKTRWRNVRKEGNYTQLDNDFLRNEEVTLEAKGLLAVFLTDNRDTFVTNMTTIINRSKNGRDKHYNVVKELISHGYFARIEIRNNGKFEAIEYIFSDRKKDVIEATEEIVKDAIEQGFTPFTENQETVKKEEEIPFTEMPETVESKTAESNTVGQYIKKTSTSSFKKTKRKKTNDKKINQSKEEEIEEKKDDGRTDVIEEVYSLVSKDMTRSQFNIVVDRINGYHKGDFRKYLLQSVANELAAIEKANKPNDAVAKGIALLKGENDSPVVEESEEELEENRKWLEELLGKMNKDTESKKVI